MIEAKKQAALLLGCYRTGDANDPEVYAAAIVAVLSDYSPEVMTEVCDPRTGLPSRLSWLPTVAEVKTACNEAHERRERMKEYAKIAPRIYGRLPSPPKAPGYRANLLVHKGHAGYDAVVQKAENADGYDWKWDEQGRGIWVTLTLWDRRNVKGKVRDHQL